MLRRVYKYQLNCEQRELQCIDVPIGASFLCFQTQMGVPTVWFEVDHLGKTEKRHYRLFGPGWDIPSEYCYVGTFQSDALVWHLYEFVP